MGKTTLLRQLAKQRTIDDRWITAAEATIQIAKARKFSDLRSTKERVFLGLLRANLRKEKHHAMAKHLVKDIRERAFWEIGDRYNLLFDIQLRGAMDQVDLAPRLKFPLLSFYLKVTRQVMLFEYCRIKQIVVLDEGPLHNNVGVAKLSRYMTQVDPEYGFNSVPDPLGVVFCKADAATVFRQVRDRWSQSGGNFLHKNLTDTQLYARIEQTLVMAREQVEQIKERKTPVLEIDTSDDRDTNIERARRFIGELGSSDG